MFKASICVDVIDAQQMDATKIDELITKGQIEVQCGRTAEAKKHAREAQVRAEEAMHRYLQSDADNEAEKKLTDWFRECCAIFAEVYNALSAVLFMNTRIICLC
ncbi:hypothetical protein DPMN_074045 [Dreissena polymorpha]|uniref:Uncharacterized protein n=1 Tax=Dreissena polymorpha TaxID=45954 RepID=A0A9D4BL97_DREPO|nr:hypothetical protein DPMN_074045 [Dreissena polymorpha]